MQHKYILIFLSLISFGYQMKGQTENCNCTETKEQSKNFEEKIISRNYVNKFIGSANQYLGGWLSGDLILKDGSVVKGENLRYNRLMDELLWARKTDYQIGLIQKEFVSSFKLYDPNLPEPIVFINLKKKNWINADSGSYYMQELTKGTLSFYIHRRAQKVGNERELSVLNDYYIVKNSIFYKVRLSKRSLYKFLDFEKDKMKAIVKEYHLNLKDERQFAKALNLYNEKY